MLLSIIIPTKNRQYTCLYAVESALKITKANFEVIVQDCSDDDSLGLQLKNKFGEDRRLKYFHSHTKPSMNENWGMAISNSSGELVYGIGDDDAVLPEIIDVAEWMSGKDIEAAIPMKIAYAWRDAYLGSYSNSRLSLASNFEGKIFKVDLGKEFVRKIKNCGFGYNFYLPNIYHGFITKKNLDLLKLKTGYYFGGTSLDVYTAFTATEFIKELYYVDYPISINGASGKSNSNRFATGKGKEHFKEFKNYIRINFLPKAFNSGVSVIETTIQALKDTNKEELIQTMNLSIVYAECAILEPKRFLHFYRDYKANKNQNYKDRDFFIVYFKFQKSKIMKDILNSLTKIIIPIFPNLEKLVERITGSKKPICNDISECLKYIETYENKNNLKIQFDREISILQTPKEIWE